MTRSKATTIGAANLSSAFAPTATAPTATAPTATRSPAADARVGDWVRAGKIRAALFLPQYAENPTTHEIQGVGSGFLGIEIARGLAEQLGVEAQIVGYPTPADVVACLKAGGCDLAYMGIEPSRAAQLDFSPAVFQFEFTYLVPDGSPIQTTAGADRPGVRIAFVRHHAAALALQRVVKNATLLDGELPESAFDMLRTGKADAMAFPRPVLLDFSAQLAGSRVLADSYGVNRVGIAIQKGNPQRLAFLREFVEHAKATGLIQRAIERGDLRGYQVAPRDDAVGR
jgi:polar amino acid transport system substrate-binding protein